MYPSLFIYCVSFRPGVDFCVTISAQEHQIIPIESDVRVVYVLGGQMNLMMDRISRSQYPLIQTSLAQSPFVGDETLSAFLPLRRLIKFFCKFFHICIQKERGSLIRVLFVRRVQWILGTYNVSPLSDDIP